MFYQLKLSLSNKTIMLGGFGRSKIFCELFHAFMETVGLRIIFKLKEVSFKKLQCTREFILHVESFPNGWIA